MHSEWPPPFDDSAAEDDGPPLRPRPSRITPRCLYELLVEHFTDERPGLSPEQRAMRFMRAFSPLSLHVPPMKTIEALANEQLIARRLAADPSTDSVRAVSQFLSEPMRVVVKTFQRTTGKSIKSLRPPPPKPPQPAPADRPMSS
ncbi:MAG TPA: hypothetical protein VGR35_01265 [Tepidisphaeraceae bacterium]|nr:hypothetical protein [Tepidisphaeraceae bacterium]